MGTPATLPANFSGFDEDKTPVASGANAPQSLPANFNGFDEDKQSSPAAPPEAQPYTMPNGRQIDPMSHTGGIPNPHAVLPTATVQAAPSPTWIDRAKNYVADSQFGKNLHTLGQEAYGFLGGGTGSEGQPETTTPSSYLDPDQYVRQVAAKNSPYKPISGAKQVVAGLSNIGESYENAQSPEGRKHDPIDQAAQGATQVMSGGMEVAKPLIVMGVAAKPIEAALYYGAGTLLGKGWDQISAEMPTTPHENEAIKTALYFIPSVLTSMAGLKTASIPEGAKVLDPVTNENVPVRGGVAGGRGFAVGVARSDTGGYAGQVRVGPYSVGVKFGRNAPEAPGGPVQPQVEPGEPQGPVAPPDAPVAPPDAVAIQQHAQAATVAETAASAASINLKAAQIVGMAPPAPPPPKPGEPGSKQAPPPAGIEQGHISQQVVNDLGTAITQLPPEAQPKAVLEATGKLAKVMFDAKTIIGPDGKVTNVTGQSPQAQEQSARTIATGIINTEVDRQAEQAKAQTEAEQQKQLDAETAAQEREIARKEAEKNQPPPPIPDNPVTQAIRASLAKLPVTTPKADVIFAVRKAGAAVGRLIPEKLATQFYDEFNAKKAQQEDAASAGITGEQVNHDQNPIALGRMANDVQQGKTAFLHVQPGTKFKPTGLTKETGFISTKVDKAADPTFNGQYFHPAEIKSKDVKLAASGEAPLAHLRGLEASWKAGHSPVTKTEAGTNGSKEPQEGEGITSAPGAQPVAAKVEEPEQKPAPDNIHEDTGLPLNQDGTVTLYHGTTKDGAAEIGRTGKLKSKGEPDVYLSTAKEGTGYGDGTVVPVRVDPSKLTLDDEFPDGRKDFRIDTGRPGGSVTVKPEQKPAEVAQTFKPGDKVTIKNSDGTTHTGIVRFTNSGGKVILKGERAAVSAKDVEPFKEVPVGPDMIRSAANDAGRVQTPLDKFEAEGKAPYEITKKDWVALQRAHREALGQSQDSGTKYAPNSDYEGFHEESVRTAKRMGLDLSEEVLKDYPDLAPKEEAGAVAPETAPPTELETWKKELSNIERTLNGRDVPGNRRQQLGSQASVLKGRIADAEHAVTVSSIPLSKPLDTLSTSPFDKWKYQGEYFVKALEPAKEAWLNKYGDLRKNQGDDEAWKYLVKHDPGGNNLPAEFPNPYIRIEVPKDGKFLVVNRPAAIDKLLKSAPSAFSKPGKALGQNPRPIPRAPKQLEADKLIAFHKAQIDETETDLRRAEASAGSTGNAEQVQFLQEKLDAAKQNLANAQEAAKAPAEPEYLSGGIGAVFSPEALKKAIDNAPGPVKDLLAKAQDEYANVRKSRSLQSGLYDLDSQATADVIRAKRFMESVPGDANDAETGYFHIEDQTIPLTDFQQKRLDEYIRPLMASTVETIEEIKGMGAELSPDLTYIHRIVKNRGGFIDRLLAGSKSTGKGNVLKTKVPSQKSRTMMAVESPDGERFVVSIKSNRVTAFVDGQPVDLGGLRNGLGTKLEEISPRLDPIAKNILDTKAEIDGTHEAERQRQIDSIEKQIERRQRDAGILSSVKGRVPGQYAAHGVEPSFGKRAGLTREIDDLEKQLDALKADTAPISAHETAALKRLNKRLAGLEADRDAILDSVPTEHLTDEIWKDKTGKEWKITQATTKEIEAQTDIEYYHSDIGSAIINWLAVEKQARAVRFLDALKSSPDFPTIAVPIAETNGAPEGWKTTQLAQMRSYYFEPHTAEVLDWYNDRLKAGDPGVWSHINDFLVSSIFFNPLLHVPNIANHWFVEKGLSGWLDPRNKVSQFKAGLKAIDAVMHQNDDFLKALDAGGPLKSQQFEARKFAETFLDKMQKELEGDPTAGQKIANALGYANPLKWLEAMKNVSSHVTWYLNDIAFLQSAYEKTAHGMDLATALQETAKHIPDYRMPTRIFDSKGLEQFLANKNLVMFMNYHYGAVKSYGETIKSLLGVDTLGKGMGNEDPSGTDYSHENAKGEPVNAAGRTREQERMHGLDILAALGLVTFILYPLLDQAAKKVTGNKDAQVRRAGASTVPYNLIQVAQGEKSPWDAIQSSVTPGVTAKLTLEAAMNRDLRTGKQIYSWPPVDTKTFAQQTGERLAASFGPAAAVQGAHNFGTAKQLWGMAGVSFPQHGGERIATEIAQAKAGSEALTPDARKRMQAHYAALDALRAGDGKTAREKMDEAGLNAKQQYALRKEADADPLLARVKTFTLDELKTVYQYSTPEEKMRLGPFLRDKEEKEHRKEIGLGIKTAQ